MADDRYLQGVQELYDGEIFGEGSASRIISLFPEVEQRRSALLLQMEGEAKVRLRPLLLRHGLSVEESESRRRAGIDFAEKRLKGLGWVEAMRVVAELSQPALDRYRQIHELAPEADRDLTAYMVEHEIVFIRFAHLEGEGRSEEAREIIAAFLDHPL